MSAWAYRKNMLFSPCFSLFLLRVYAAHYRFYYRTPASTPAASPSLAFQYTRPNAR